MKALIKKFLPKSVLSNYHKALSLLAAFVYGYPSEKMIVVGVTGTNGKSTTVNLIARALESSGALVGATSTVNFKIAEKEWLNNKKMTMLGRFQLQKLLNQMVKAGCRYAVVEVSSEGIKQYRHLGINFDYAVFTNLTPEHIESHGGFENYKKAKSELFRTLTVKNRKKVKDVLPLSVSAEGEDIKKISVINIGDEHAEYFLQFPTDEQIGFAAGAERVAAEFRASRVDKFYLAKDIQVSRSGTSFSVLGREIHLKLIGEFNAENALPAIAIAEQEGIPFEKIKSALEKVAIVPGRMEFIDAGQDFVALVDYAPEPASMTKMYQTIQAADFKLPGAKIIHVLGSCGGGRDRARRPILGEMAGKNADIVIITNEDPYDDDPQEIIDQVADGAINAGKKENKNLFKIVDRRAAIQKAVGLARKGDLIIVTGKGAEQAMAVAGGRYIPWDDREVIREAIFENAKSKAQSAK